MDTPFDRPVVCPVVIGRAAHLAALADCLAQARIGSGQLVLISGEAGIGKSRLVAEAQRLAVDVGMRVLQGWCFEYDRALPYAPLLDLWRGFLGGAPQEEVADLLGPAAAELVAILPELAGRFPARPPGPAPDPEQEKDRLFQALARVFTDLAAREPLLVVVEDLHWADATSLDFLRMLARRVVGRPILLLLTYRDDEVGAGLATLLAELDRARQTAELRLARLAPADVAAMLAAIFGPERSIRATFLDRLCALTEGNPFFIEEVLRSLLAAGDAALDGAWQHREHDDRHIPRSVGDAVRRRVEALSEPARHALTLAAIAGHRFEFAPLQELTGADERALLAQLRELIAAGLVVEESADSFTFRHALTRQAICADLLTRERRVLHHTVAEAIERLQIPPDARLGDLAYHFFEAAVWDKALHYAERAGRHAQVLYAPGAAVEHFSRAIDAARALGRPPSPTLHRERGRAYELLGDFERARADLALALALADAAGERRAAWQALIDLGLLWAGRDYARAGEQYRQALELARSLGEPAAVAHSLNRLGNWHANCQQPDAALRHHHEALAIFRASDDRDGLAETFDLLGMASFLGGNPHRCALYYEQAIGHFRALDRRQGLASTLATLAVCGPTYQLSVADPAARSPAEFVRVGEEALRITREIGWRSGETYALGTLAQCLGARGEYARALELARSAISVAEEIEHRQWLAHAHWVAGMLAHDLLALPEARRHLDHALALARASSSSHWIHTVAAFLAAVSLAEGDLARADAVIEEAIGQDETALTLGQRLVWCVRAELALARGDADRSLRIVDRLLDVAATSAPAPGERAIARLAKVRGEALIALGRATEAEAALQAARDVAHAQGTRPLLWRIQVALGDLCHRRRHHAAADECFAAARALVAELAATIPDNPTRQQFLDRATARLPRHRAPSPLRAARQAFGGLTPREREVAAQIALGKSNREIAGVLFASERTIATHVSNILAKLDFTSRAQIAAWAQAQGLPSLD